MLKHLIEFGVGTNKELNTTLNIACFKRRKNVVGTLIELGTIVNKQDI